MMIKILGKGRPKCERLEQLTRDALQETGIADATIEHVRDMDAIMAYPILSTPGLVIEEALKSSGRLPRKQEIVAWLREADERPATSA